MITRKCCFTNVVSARKQKAMLLPMGKFRGMELQQAQDVPKRRVRWGLGSFPHSFLCSILSGRGICKLNHRNRTKEDFFFFGFGLGLVSLAALEVTIQTNLTSDSPRSSQRSTCLCFPSAKIRGVDHQARQQGVLNGLGLLYVNSGRWAVAGYTFQTAIKS